MDQHRLSIANPGNSRFPPFFPPPNPHHNHHHNHLPPPPRLPPPPHLPHQSPISLPPPPPPPPHSFHHHPGHSSHQFVDHPPPHRGRQQQPLDPNLIHHHRNHNHNLNNRPLDFQQAPRRVPERLVAVDRRRNRPFPTFRGHDPDPAVWNPPPRVPVDATLPPPSITRRIPRACFDREHPSYRPTFQPVDRFRNDQDGGSRVRKDSSESWFRVDELPRERRDGFSRNDNRFQRDVDCNIHRKEFVSSKVEHFSGLVTQKELVIQRRGDVVDGNLMWKNLSREAPHSPMEVRNRAIDIGNEFHEKGKNRVLESERYGDRDRWEDAQDYNLTPRKKQKKNVLLRIQPAKPSFRNNYERSPSLCRDREPLQFPDHRLNKVRERSPIVSFKSNLLIVGSSSSGAGADEVFADRDDKNWNELGNKDDLLLPSNVVEKVSLKTDSDNHCENVPCTLKKEEIHLEKNPEPPTNLKKLNPSPSHEPPDGNLAALSHKTECLSEDKKACKSPNGKVLDKSYVASGSGKECSPSFREKRKITNPCTSLSSSQVLRKDLESVVFDEGLKDSGKDLTAAVKVTESTEIALTSPHMKSSDIGSTEAVDGKCADDSVSAAASISRSKRRKQRKRLLKQLSGKPDEIQVDVIGPTQDAQRTSNSEGVIDMAQKGSSSYMVRNDSRNMCLDVVSVPLQHGFAKRSSEAAPSTEGCTNVCSAPNSMNSSERQLNISRSGGADTASRSLGVSDIVKEASQNQSSASLEEGEIEESVDADLSEKDNKSTKVSVLEEFHIREISDISRCNLAITLAADNVVPEDSGQSINGSDANAVNDALNMSCTGRISPSIEVGVSRGFPESETLKGDLSLFPSEGSLTKNVRKRKISELHRGTGKNNAYNVTLGCSTDSYLAQDKVAGSGFTCPDGDCISTNRSEVRISSQEVEASDNPCVNDHPSEVVTPTCNKKCKILTPELGSAHGTPTEICEKLAYSDVLPCDAEVPEHSIQILPISSVDVGLSVSEFGSQSDLAHQRKGLDLNSFNDASAQISAGLKSADETCGKGGSNFVLSGTADMSGIPDEKRTSSKLESVSRAQGDGTLLMTGAIDGYCGIGIESGSGRSIHDRNAAGDCSLQNQFIDHEPLVRDMKGDINIPGKGDLSSQSEHLTLFTQPTSDDRVANPSPMDNLSLVENPENLSAATSLEMFNVPNLNGNLDRKLCSAQRRSSGKSTMEASFISSISNSTPNHIVNSKLASAADGIANNSGKTMPFIRASQSSKEGLQNSSNMRKKQTRIKNEVNLASSKALSSRSSFLPSSGRRPTTVIKSRTWHRTDNPASNQVARQNSSIRFVPQQKQNVSQTVGAQSNSYVRKGNSLLRNPATAVSQSPETSAPATSVPQLNLSASEDAKNTPCEIPERLSSPCNIDSSNYIVAPVGDSSCSPVADSSMATENGPQGSPKDMPKSSGNSDFEMSKSLEDQGSLNYSNQAASFTRRMVYVKHKSNQLVAAANSSSEISASNKDIPALTSDVYFKSKKNQLVRATSETHSRQTSADPVDEGRRVFKSYVSRSATRRDPNRVSQKIPKSQKFSSVWKLCNTRSPKKGVNSLRCQQVLPHLLPWKRATYWRSLFRTSADLFKNSSLSHKFLSSRKTHIIYKRSGFSLRRSKVVSLAGSSLKWSISLEKRSKKVDKEANLAVAALEKEKREKSSGSVISSGVERKQNSLHEEHSRRRLRNDEYVRIGNGNQLIRNPKRRTRILANEKVRWSLHTARMRLAKKRKYCQFFTRFGKCNKGEGKCPYIHDPSKTAVCTKFLNGLCSDPRCKLTHKVIPERMPDCSFFLHGLCSNESCPYRHISVNPKAAICESFLKGYCAEGNECRKKHSYMCPIYEAAGECPEGSKCKLYHKKGKYNKRKNTKHQKSVRGRYFGSRPAKGNNNEPETEGFRKRLEPKDDGIILENGALTDFISLDVSGDEEDGEQEDEVSRQSNQSCWEEQLSIVSEDDPDELIKPIGLLRIMSQAAEGTA